MLKSIIIFCLTIYQRTLSPDHGLLRYRYPHGYCKFQPSCSQYAKEAVSIHGVLWGSGLALGRLLRCHPWAESKVDPVPKSI